MLKCNHDSSPINVCNDQIRVLFPKARRIFYKSFYDVIIFPQPFRAVCLERLREYCDAIEISVEYFDILNREHSSNQKISST